MIFLKCCGTFRKGHLRKKVLLPFKSKNWGCQWPPWHPQFRWPFFKTIFSFFALEKQQLRCQNPATTVQPTKLCWVSFVLWAHLLCYNLFYEKSYLSAEQGIKGNMQENAPFSMFWRCSVWLTYLLPFGAQTFQKLFKKSSLFPIFTKKHIWIYFTCRRKVDPISVFASRDRLFGI